MKYTALIAVSGIVAGLVGGMVFFGLFSGIESVLTDRLFGEKSLDGRVVIVGIDTKSLGELGQWPLPRSVIADGLENIIAAEPRSIGIDILFADPSRLGETDDNTLSAVLMGSAVPITLPVEAAALRIGGETVPKAEDIIRTLDIFSGEKITYGHVNIVKDRDGVVRRFPASILSGTESIPSFSGQVVGNPNTGSGVEHIVWSGPPGTVPHISFSDIVHDRVSTETLRGAYVFIGATAADLHDEQTTPTSAGTPMAGVEIQAQIGNMLLSGFTLHPITPFSFTLWLLVLGLIPILSFFFLRKVTLALIGVLILFFVNLTTITTLFESGTLVSIVHTSLTIILASIAAFSVRYFILERERREIRGVFSKYVSSAVLEELLNNPSAVKLGGSEAEVTIFFSDIRGFTTLSEKLTPRELTELLNRYLTHMTDVILKDKGVVDKYIGDAIMAFWGAPLPEEHHAYRAIQSSLTMLEALDSFNEENTKSGSPTINIGIGLNTGNVIVGNMGSHQRFDYTIMGDAVNLGSRIEGQTKTYGVRLLVSEMTIAALTKSGHMSEFVTREVDKVTVKGKKEPVALFEVAERKHEERVRNILDAFTKIREHYYKGEWQMVITLGEAVLKEVDDGPTKVLLGRAKEFLSTPPDSWTGVYELTSK